MFVNPDCCCKNFLSHIRVKIPLIHAYESQNYDDGELHTSRKITMMVSNYSYNQMINVGAVPVFLGV